MYDAQMIQMNGSTASSLFSPWFPRGGDYGLFTLEVVAIAGSGTPRLTVDLYHKKASETGDGALAAGSMNFYLEAVDRLTKDYKESAGSSPTFGGFYELVRYKFTISGGSTGASWATYRILPPVWYDNVPA